MKWTFLLLVILVSGNILGQNLTGIRTASLMDGDYTIAGTVYLESFDDGSLDLRFDNNYLTQSNVYDVHVFLTNNNNYYSAPIDTTGMLLVANIGTIRGLNYSSGARTFNLPSGVSINDYQYIVFICVQYGRLHWGNGTFSTAVTTNLLQIEETTKLSAKVYPNPSESGLLTIELENADQEILLEVLNSNGQVIREEQISRQKLYFLELEDRGIYFIRLTSDQASVIKRVVRI